jgi:hypothetical protein
MMSPTPQQDNIADLIAELTGIWKYASMDLHAKNEGKKTGQEYELTLIKLWDKLDTLSLTEVEDVQVELDGRRMGENCDVVDKILRTQLIDYMVVRIQQDRGVIQE